MTQADRSSPVPDRPAPEPDSTAAPDATELDITGEVCPMTLVRTRLALDRLPSGATLRVRLSGAEPALEVPRAAEELGHQVVSVSSGPGAVTVVLLRRR